MPTTITRITRRTVDIPVDVGVRIREIYSDALFRPTWIVEELREPGQYEYVVMVRGPVQTKTGKDHFSSQASRTFGDWNGNPVSNIPEALYPYLVGPEVLAYHDFGGVA